MLKTITCLSGIYCASNIILITKNIKLINQNMIMTLNGRSTLNNSPIFKNSNDHTIWWINNKTCMLYNVDSPFKTAMFSDNTDQFQTLCFNDVDECKNYCMENKMKFDNISYDQIKIETIDTDKIWMLYDSTTSRYTILSKTTESEFKQFMIKKHQLPFRKINFILFVALLVLLYMQQ